MPLSPSRSRALALWAVLLAANFGCAGAPSTFDRSELERESAGLVLGEFPLKQNAIVDGDTIKVDGLDTSLRLLGIDTEETFKSNKSWREFEVGWEEYIAAKQAQTSRPIKVPTPLGMDAKHWAEDFFVGVTRVRLERDHPKEIRGRYNRYLAYVFVERDGEWVNYNVEAVRAGMSPYFTKYGYSRRYHQAFLDAEAEARAQRRGIWAEGAQCYQDYPLREDWWNGRAEFVAAFERDAEGDPALIALTNWDAMDRIEARLGDEVELLATVGEVRQGKRGPKRVLLSRRMFNDFPLIFWDDDIYEASGIDAYRGEYIRVRGVVTSYTDRRSGERQLQIEVQVPEQIVTPRYVPPGKAGDVDPELASERPPGEGESEEAVEQPDDFSPPERKPEPKPEPAPEPADDDTDDDADEDDDDDDADDDDDTDDDDDDDDDTDDAETPATN